MTTDEWTDYHEFRKRTDPPPWGLGLDDEDEGCPCDGEPPCACGCGRCCS